MVSTAPLLKLTTLLLPELPNALNVWLVENVSVTLAGFFDSVRNTPAASLANTFATPSVRPPESTVIAPVSLLTAPSVTVPDPAKVNPPLPVIAAVTESVPLPKITPSLAPNASVPPLIAPPWRIRPAGLLPSPRVTVYPVAVIVAPLLTVNAKACAF